MTTYATDLEKSTSITSPPVQTTPVPVSDMVGKIKPMERDDVQTRLY